MADDIGQGVGEAYDLLRTSPDGAYEMLSLSLNDDSAVQKTTVNAAVVQHAQALREDPSLFNESIDRAFDGLYQNNHAMLTNAPTACLFMASSAFATFTEHIYGYKSNQRAQKTSPRRVLATSASAVRARGPLLKLLKARVKKQHEVEKKEKRDEEVEEKNDDREEQQGNKKMKGRKNKRSTMKARHSRVKNDEENEGMEETRSVEDRDEEEPKEKEAVDEEEETMEEEQDQPIEGETTAAVDEQEELAHKEEKTMDVADIGEDTANELHPNEAAAVKEGKDEESERDEVTGGDEKMDDEPVRSVPSVDGVHLQDGEEEQDEQEGGEVIVPEMIGEEEIVDHENQNQKATDSDGAYLQIVTKQMVAPSLHIRVPLPSGIPKPMSHGNYDVPTFSPLPPVKRRLFT